MEEKSKDETVSFRKDEIITYGVLNYDNDDLMCTISGYGLNIAFNMRLINSLEDAENCADALADVFYQALMEQLIAQNPEIIKPVHKQRAILKKESRQADNINTDEGEGTT